MAATSNFHFYENLLNNLTASLGTYVSDTATSVINAITPVATTLVAIYVALWGWSMMRGIISEPITDGAWRILRLTFILAIALSLGRYSTYLADFLWGAPDALASVVVGGYSSTTSIQFLDTLLSKMYDYGHAFYDAANANSTLGIPDLGQLASAILIWAAGVLVTGYAAFLYALSKMALAIILAVGPIFVLLTIFEPTKRFFDAWIGQALNYVFTVMLTAATAGLILSILQTFLGTPSVIANMAAPEIPGAIPAIVFSIIGLLVLMQVPSIASALGGGVAIGTLGAVGWAYGRTKGGLTAMRPTNLKRSANKVRADFRIARDATKSAAGAPMAAYRKITGGSKNRVAQG